MGESRDCDPYPSFTTFNFEGEIFFSISDWRIGAKKRVLDERATRLSSGKFKSVRENEKKDERASKYVLNPQALELAQRHSILFIILEK